MIFWKPKAARRLRRGFRKACGRHSERFARRVLPEEAVVAHHPRGLPLRPDVRVQVVGGRRAQVVDDVVVERVALGSREVGARPRVGLPQDLRREVSGDDEHVVVDVDAGELDGVPARAMRVHAALALREDARAVDGVEVARLDQQIVEAGAVGRVGHLESDARRVLAKVEVVAKGQQSADVVSLTGIRAGGVVAQCVLPACARPRRRCSTRWRPRSARSD